MKTVNALLAIGLTLLTVQASAAAGTEVGVFFGAKNAEFDTDTAGVDFSSTTGLMGGAIAYGEMGGMLFRTGGYYSERKTEVTVGGVSADLKIAALDVPVTLMYSFNDMFSMFGGALFALKLSDDCSGDTSICNSDAAKKTESFHAAVTVGLNAKFHPNWSGEMFYEHGFTDLSDDVTASAISAAVVFIY